MKFLVYTSVFGGYDRVFPPVRTDLELDYLIVTDDANLRVDGWQTLVVDSTHFKGPRSANRYYKMLGHRIFNQYSASAYIDGNIRMLGAAAGLLRGIVNSKVALGLYRHPLRDSVAAEVEACIANRKVIVTPQNEGELRDYFSDGFPDKQGLVEATVLLKNHQHPELDGAMMLWWTLFERYGTRDQFSLPYVLWKTGVPHAWQARSFREPNPYFGIYPHMGARHVTARYVYVCARSYDSLFFRIVLQAWHSKWWLQRKLRGWKFTFS